MKIIPDKKAVAGQRVQFDVPLGTMTSVHRALLLAAVLERANPGEQHCDVIYEALARAEDSVRTALAQAEKAHEAY